VLYRKSTIHGFNPLSFGFIFTVPAAERRAFGSQDMGVVSQSIQQGSGELGDTAAAGAILDRFLHHAEVIRLQGRSYRMYNRRELLNKQQPEEALTGQTK